ncbi:GNAT family N-acetyltransferase [Streptomyces sp. NPDC000594]|uniref:GNAT family N-acetyltransferase n=1 Tax=Streptomyces sp. NPDC000594 TaxID=3154261 RepID=UPI0033183A24
MAETTADTTVGTTVGTTVEIREMVEGDIDAVSGIRVAGWRWGYAGIVPASYLDAMTVAEDAVRRRAWFTHQQRRSLDLVAVDGGVPVGWIAARPGANGPDEPNGSGGSDGPGAGEVLALYLLPDRVGRGIGRALLAGAHTRLAERGCHRSELWVIEENHRARRFYERAGYRADGARRDDVYDGTALPEIRYRRSLGGAGSPN